MKLFISRNEVTPEIADLINSKLKNVRYAYSTIYLEQDREPLFFNTTGILEGATFTPAHDEYDENGKNLFHWPNSLHVQVRDEKGYSNYYSREDSFTGERGDMWANDSREPGEETVWYFTNGDEIHWIFDRRKK